MHVENNVPEDWKHIPCVAIGDESHCLPLLEGEHLDVMKVESPTTEFNMLILKGDGGFVSALVEVENYPLLCKCAEETVPLVEVDW